jgi:DNA-binding MarR family transcriptional regulator
MPTTSESGDRRRALELALGEQINALISATRALSEQSAASFHEGLQPAAFHVARWLHAFGPARPSAVAEAVRMDRSSTSTLIGRMRSLGLVESTPDPRDRRGVVVGLTAEGHARVSATLEERGAQFFERIRTWSEDDLERLSTLLRQLTTESDA